MHTHKLLAAVAGITFLGLSAISFADAPDGAALYQKSCLACHGVDANTPILPIYPKLAGQNEEYLLNQLRDIKVGARNNGQSIIMMGILIPLSDADMGAISKWIAAQ